MKEPELEQIEYKQSLGEWKEIVETVAAFATARGGVIHVGVAPTGDYTGVQVGRGTLEDITNKIKVNTDPPQYPAIEMEGSAKSAVLTLTVEESPVKPVWALGRPYKRVGRTNQRLSPDETQRLMEMTTSRSWDALLCGEARNKDLDRKAIEEFLRLAKLPLSSSTATVLQNLKLLGDPGVRNAAVLLFARDPQRMILSAKVQCGRFRAVTSVDFIDEQTLGQTVLKQIEDAQKFIARNTQRALIITGKPQREEVSEYPEDAMREAVTNAVCHRDYTRPEAVQVRVYDDRLEVWNPATMPPDLSIEALYREHPSRPRNPLLANALHSARLIEHWGTGTLRMIQACEGHGLPRPEFSYQMGQFMVCFRKPVRLESVDLPSGVGERQSKVLAHIRQHGSITSIQYETLFQISRRQAQRELKELVISGVLVPSGKGSATRYVLVGEPIG